MPMMILNREKYIAHICHIRNILNRIIDELQEDEPDYALVSNRLMLAADWLLGAQHALAASRAAELR